MFPFRDALSSPLTPEAPISSQTPAETPVESPSPLPALPLETRDNRESLNSVHLTSNTLGASASSASASSDNVDGRPCLASLCMFYH